MAHTYSNLVFHIVFGTQGRLNLIRPEIKQELYSYIAGLIKQKGGKLIIAGGIADHIHLLVVLPPDISISDVMKFLKANSSRWVKQRFNSPFSWQKGFGAFTVSRSNVPAVARYIRDQEIHHHQLDFEREFALLLDKNGVEYDANFIWK